MRMQSASVFFFFNDTATTEIYPLSLHDALPICMPETTPAPPNICSARSITAWADSVAVILAMAEMTATESAQADRKSTRLNSSHVRISDAVFCLKKKKPKRAIAQCSSQHAAQQA